jgi:hypothetical protein
MEDPASVKNESSTDVTEHHTTTKETVPYALDLSSAATAAPPPPKSKNALKRERKKLEWLERRPEKRAMERAKRKLKDKESGVG